VGQRPFLCFIGLYCALLDAELAVDFFAGCGGFLFAFLFFLFLILDALEFWARKGEQGVDAAKDFFAYGQRLVRARE